MLQGIVTEFKQDMIGQLGRSARPHPRQLWGSMVPFDSQDGLALPQTLALF